MLGGQRTPTPPDIITHTPSLMRSSSLLWFTRLWTFVFEVQGRQVQQYVGSNSHSIGEKIKRIVIVSAPGGGLVLLLLWRSRYGTYKFPNRYERFSNFVLLLLFLLSSSPLLSTRLLLSPLRSCTILSFPLLSICLPPQSTPLI